MTSDKGDHSILLESKCFVSDAYILFIYIIISIAFRKCTLEQNLAHMQREILNHNIHIIYVHLLALIERS